MTGREMRTQKSRRARYLYNEKHKQTDVSLHMSNLNLMPL